MSIAESPEIHQNFMHPNREQWAMMGLIKFLNLLPFVCFIRLGGENDISGLGVEITNLRNASLDHRS